MRIQNVISLCPSVIFLGSCSLIPSPRQTSNSNATSKTVLSAQNRAGSNRKIAIPASYIVPQQHNVAKTVTFPNMVKTTEINEPQSTEIQEVESLLKSEGIDIDDLESLDDGGFSTQSFNSRRLFFAQFKTRVGRRACSYQVKISANGQFELKLKEGSSYKILDNDATDGTAVIQIPSATLKTWLHLSRNWGKDSELMVEDPLYYMSDTLSSKHKRWLSRTRWLSMGLRPLPVPAEWKSNNGNDFVLNMNVKNLNSFSMIWLQQNNQQEIYPPGVKKIGPEGGLIELPGVGEFGVAIDAVDRPTVFSMRQLTNFQTPDFYGLPKSSYVGPIVSIEPVIKLNTRYPSGVRLNIDKDLLKKDPMFLIYYAWQNQDPPNGSQLGRLVESNTRASFDDYHMIEHTGIVTPTYTLPALETSNSNKSSFQIQQLSGINWANEGNI